MYHVRAQGVDEHNNSVTAILLGVWPSISGTVDAVYDEVVKSNQEYPGEDLCNKQKQPTVLNT